MIGGEIDEVSSEIDPVTLSVIAGALRSTVRQMTVTVERTARSEVFKLVHDYSNAIFDSQPQMAVQGSDLPIHLGSLIFAMKEVAGYFGDDIAEGDVFYHNDPSTGGSHLQDMCMFKPVFFDDQLVFWVANKAHMGDTGGVVAGGYNPQAEEIYAEGLRITPVRIYRRGLPCRDVLDFIVGNLRTRTQMRGDMAGQLAALTIADRNLRHLLDRYGTKTVTGSVARILDIGERDMRAAVTAIPDGVYEGTSRVEDDGRSGEMSINCRVEIIDDQIAVTVISPRQARSYINSYWANTISAVYSAVLSYARLPGPFNEGMYRPVRVDLGPAGTLTNATHPAPCGSCTSTVGDNITEAVRIALSAAVPERAVAGWCHGAGTIQVGTNPYTDELYVFNVVIGTDGGAGASWGLDGWHCLGLAAAGGGVLAGDVELIEYEYPVQIDRYELRQDSGGAGRWHGGLGPVFEAQPLEHEASVVGFGEGYVYPTPGVLGAVSRLSDRKLARRYLIVDGRRTEIPPNTVITIRPGEQLQTRPQGGGGVGDPFERELNAVVSDVRNGYISVEAARVEYGVVIDSSTMALDDAATTALRDRTK